MTYKYLGNDDYLITLEIDRDCHGEDGVLTQDNPAYIGVFKANGQRLLIDSVLYATSTISLSPVVTNCQHLWDTCYDRIKFEKVFHLPADTAGYTVVYQRCCRDEEMVNVDQPVMAGVAYYCKYHPRDRKIIVRYLKMYHYKSSV
jgi:hypothetical protein